MFELQGRYATAKVFAEEVEQHAVAQILLLCNQAFMEGSRVRIMPDVHAGAGCTVGTTLTLKDRVVPNLVGVDIGCGMEVVRLRETRLEPAKLDKVIREGVPSGFAIRKTAHRYAAETGLQALRCAEAVNIDKALLSIGTLGGGNHFIEVDRGEDGALYLVIHSGSRHLGLEVAKYYQRLAFHQCNGSDGAAVAALIQRLKAEGRAKRIEQEVRKLTNTKVTDIPRELCYVSGSLFDDYLHDMRLLQAFADWNRRAMAETLQRGLGLHAEDRFCTVHNYIDIDKGILRKGAVSAQEGERLLIPMNMRDGALLGTGLGNEDWNWSAPHGAGRLMSRSETKQRFTLSEYRRQMEGVYTTSVSRETLDESPMAYKPMESILACIRPTVRVEQRLLPVYNFKAGGEPEKE